MVNCSYISGFFDADGYITICSPGNNQQPTTYVGFTNNVLSILKEIQKIILKEIGIKGVITCKKPAKKHHGISYELKYKGLKKAEMLGSFMNSNHPKKVERFRIAKQMRKFTPRNGKYSAKQLKERNKLIEKFLKTL